MAVDLDRVQEIYGNTLTDVQRARVQLDIDAVTEALQGWLKRKLTDTTITDERHVGVSEIEDFRFDWRPVSAMLGVKWGTATATLETTYNDYYHELLVPRDQVYYISYIAKGLTGYTNTIDRIIINAVMHELLKPDVIRYNVVSSYSVEGLSITYNTQGVPGGADLPDVGPISGTDLSMLKGQKRMVIV